MRLSKSEKKHILFLFVFLFVQILSNETNSNQKSTCIYKYPGFVIATFQKYEIWTFDLSKFRNVKLSKFRISTFQHFEISNFRKLEISKFWKFGISTFRNLEVSTFRTFARLDEFDYIGASTAFWSAGVDNSGTEAWSHCDLVGGLQGSQRSCSNRSKSRRSTWRESSKSCE